MKFVFQNNKHLGKVLVSIAFFSMILAKSSFCADVIADNLTVNNTVGIGFSPATTQGIFVNHQNYGPGNSNIYGYRAGGTGSAGTGWDVNNVESVFKGYSGNGDAYSASVIAYNSMAWGTLTPAAALVAAPDRNPSSNSAFLAYRDPLSAGGFFSAYFNGNIVMGPAIAGQRWIIYSDSHLFTIAPDLGSNFDWNKNFTINKTNGQVGIGAAPSDGCTSRLLVNGNTSINGTLYAKSIEVNTTIPWADYVFNKNYKVKSLSETESYIKKNGHLPGIPSKNDIAKNGVNVVDLQVKMLKTMEEMTLHMIAMKKENELLSAQNQALTTKIGEIEKKLR